MQQKYGIALYVLYAAIYVGAFFLYLLLDGVDMVGNNAQALYTINLASIALTFVGLYVAYSFERLPFVRKRLANSDAQQAERMRRLVPYAKVFIFGFLLFHNTILYCLATYAQGTLKYCVLITLVLGVLVYPRIPRSSPPAL